MLCSRKKWKIAKTEEHFFFQVKSAQEILNKDYDEAYKHWVTERTEKKIIFVLVAITLSEREKKK